MKRRIKPLSMSRDVKSGMQRFRETELYGICFGRIPNWPCIEWGGPYREAHNTRQIR